MKTIITQKVKLDDGSYYVMNFPGSNYIMEKNKMTGKQAICIDCGEKYLSFASAKRCMECRDERMVAQSIERKRLKRIRERLKKKV